ncbi:MAG: putative sugar nucleotidyl transferase, partial [Planctomycetota bacterium]
MAMRLAIFEDHFALQFAPISLMRPVFELLCGQFTSRERLLKSIPVDEWGVLIRPALTEVYAEQFADARINDAIWLSEDSTLLINARWLPSNDEICRLAEVSSDTVGVMGDSVAYLLLEPEEAALLTTDAWDNAIKKIAETRQAIKVEGVELQHPWDLVNQNRRQLLADFSLYQTSDQDTGDAKNLTIVGPPGLVKLSASAEIDPFVVLDTRHGPV